MDQSKLLNLRAGIGTLTYCYYLLQKEIYHLHYPRILVSQDL